MEFKSKAQQECWGKVEGWAREIFGEMLLTPRDEPEFGIVHGSTLTRTRVLAWGDDQAAVVTRSYVVMRAELTPDLMLFLLKKNNETMLGAFGVDSDGDIFFDHTILGTTIDKAELRASVLAVMQTADKYDDEIVARWGGLRARDQVSR